MPRGFDCPFGTNFDVPFDYGYGQYFWSEKRTHTPMFIMVDKVRAPTERGEWVLRWRWDVEQNPQVRAHLSLSLLVAPDMRVCLHCELTRSSIWLCVRNLDQSQVWTHCADITVV